MIVLSIIFSTYICAYYLFLGLGYLKSSRKLINQEDSPLISVLIAAHNEEENLKTYLPKVLNQAYKNFEVIVALDRCSDNSLQYLQSLDHCKLHFFEVQNKQEISGKKAALQEALLKAKGSYIQFTDADCYPASENWLRDMVSTSIQNSYDIVLGLSPYEKNSSFLNGFIQEETFTTVGHMIISNALQIPYVALGRNTLYKREMLSSEFYSEMGHIHGGDDDLIFQKTKGSFGLCSSAGSKMYSIPKNSWKSYINQKLRHLHVSKHYSLSAKVLSLFLNSITIVQALFVILLLLHFHIYSLVLFLWSLILREGIRTWIAKKTGMPKSRKWGFFFDYCYFLYLSTLGVTGLLVKRTRWM